MAIDMEPKHGCIWIYDTGDQQTVAYTRDGIEDLREMLPEYKRQPIIPAVLGGWLPCRRVEIVHIGDGTARPSPAVEADQLAVANIIGLPATSEMNSRCCI